MSQGNRAAAALPTEETTFSFSGKAPSPEDQRQYPRRMTTLRVGTILIGDRRELCLIRNVSAKGLGIHVYSPLEMGQRVSVELKTNQQTSGTVSWIEDGNVGIEFDELIDIEDLLASAGTGENGWHPRMPRVELDRLGELRLGARIYPINTRDISQGGVRIEIDHPLQVGDPIVLTLEKWRPIHGVVRWYDDGQAGIAFNQLLSFQELMGGLRQA